MADYSKTIIVGRLTRDPEIKDINGLKIAKFSVATNKSWKNESGEKQTKVQYHEITAFKRLAELCGQYLSKGQPVFLEGENETSEWEKDGIKRKSTTIIANNIQFLGDGKAAADNSVDHTNSYASSIASDDPF